MVNEDACEAAGLDIPTVTSIARRLSRAARDARALGLVIFGGAGTGTLRYNDGEGRLIIASLDGDFDGGDGATHHDAQGLERGEE